MVVGLLAVDCGTVLRIGSIVSLVNRPLLVNLRWGDVAASQISLLLIRHALTKLFVEPALISKDSGF